MPPIPRASTSAQYVRHLAANAARAADFFRRLRIEDTIGLVGPTAYGELVHLLIRQLLEQHGQTLTPRLPWVKVYKYLPSALSGLRSDLVQIEGALARTGLVFLSPDELSPIGAGTAYLDRLIDRCRAYALDTRDVELLIEAERLGSDAIATMDGDDQRAVADFDISTWL